MGSLSGQPHTLSHCLSYPLSLSPQGLSQTVQMLVFELPDNPHANPFVYGHWAPYAFVPVMAVSIFAQMRHLNRALDRFGATQVCIEHEGSMLACATIMVS